MARPADDEGRPRQTWLAALVAEGDFDEAQTAMGRHGPLSLERTGPEAGAQTFVLATFGSATDAIAAALDVRRRLGPTSGAGVATGPQRAKELARENATGLPDEPGAVLVDRRIHDLLQDAVRTTPLASSGSAQTTAAVTGLVGRHDGGEPTGWRDRVEIGAALVGAVAALAIWVTLVGGVTMWVRLHRANVPETEALSILPRGVLEAEGIRVILVTLLVALPVTALVGFAWANGRRLGAHARGLAEDAGGLGSAIAAAVVVLVVLFFTRRWLDLQWRGLAAILVISGAALVFLILALARVRHRVWRWLTIFAVVVLAAGFAGLAREWGSRSIRIDSARVVLEDDRGSFEALFVARTSDTLYVAHRMGNDATCSLRMLGNDRVRDLWIEGSHPTTICPRTIAGASPGGDTTTVVKTATTTSTIVTTTTTPGPSTTTTVVKGTVTVAPVTVTLPPRVVLQTVATTTTTTTATTTELPAGAHPAPHGGGVSIPVESVRLPLRLEISAPSYDPREPLHDTRELTVTFRITATGGYFVDRAGVYVRALRSAYFREAGRDVSDEDGWVHVKLQPTDQLPFGSDVRIALFVRAWNPAGSLLGGSSQRRLVELRLGQRR